MLTCRELVGKADQYLDGELSLRERMAIRMHILVCHHCRRYLRQLGALLRAFPRRHKAASNEEVCAVMEHLRQHADDQDKPG